MRRLTTVIIQVILTLSMLASWLAVPLTAQSSPAAAEPAAIAQSQPVEGISAETGQADPAKLIPEEGVVQNADPYLTSLALGYEQPTSRYGPVRNNPDEGIPRYAYSPFQEPEKREVCPPGGCDYMAGQLLIKFALDSTLRDAGARGVLPMEEGLLATMDEFDILSLTQIFPDAEKPLPGERIATADGDLIPAPDLTLWYRAETRSTESLGTIARSLAESESIAWVEPDFVRKPIGMPIDEVSFMAPTSQPAPLGLPGSGTDPLYDQQWHLDAANIPQAWAHLESQGLPPGGNRDIVVAVIDTGVDYTHPDLAANMWVNPAEFYGTPGVDDDGNGYVDDIHGARVIRGSRSGDPQDDHGHGTHVAGIIAAQADNGIGGVGVAYNVQIMAIKAAQYSGVLAASDIAEGIYYAVSRGADVINMSFGGYARSQVEEDALAVAFGQAVLVAAAGNDANVNLPCLGGMNMYPAAYNWVLGVMASTKTANEFGSYLAFFSNFDCISHDAQEYELMAPGVGIYSTLPGEQYAAWSGTSMAAPIVSGIAALARTQWADKDVYSSRFIMGQIASNTSQPIGGVANALTALSVLPKPELSYLQHWLFDTPDINPINDNDGIVDAGETVELAIMLRNHWGKASNVTASLEAWAEGAVFPDPFVTMLVDTIDYGAIGSFNWKDNGLIYDAEGAITGVAFPFRFSTSPDTPNDHVIPFKLTVTGKNGYDPDDPVIYTAVSRFYLLVQRGRELPRIISEDMTLSKEYYWLVPDAVLIAEGATVTVTEGTQIQFWSAQPEDPLAEEVFPFIQVEGSLIVEGTPIGPVEMFPSAFHPLSIVYIWNKDLGITELTFAKLMNFGSQGQITIDHCEFGQLPLEQIFIPYGFSLDFSSSQVTKTRFKELSFSTTTGGTILFHSVSSLSESLCDHCWIRLKNSNIINSVFLINTKNGNPSMFPSFMFSNASGVGSPKSTFINNAILNRWWNLTKDYWLTFTDPGVRGEILNIQDNYWGTSSDLIDFAITDFYDDFNLGVYQYQPILTQAPETAYPFVVDVLLNTEGQAPKSCLNGPTPLAGAEPVTFTVTFNRDMDQNIQPLVSFGPDVPMTDYTVHPVAGGWTDARTWAGTFNITPYTGDGYQLIRAAGAVAADDPWLVTGDDAGRFRFRVETTGTAAMNLQATGGEGYVDLTWTQTDFDLLAGFNLYRAASSDGDYTRLNATIIPPEIRNFRDTDVTPGQPYFYKFTVVKTDMSESGFSNVASATSLDTIPPTLHHTPVTSAPPGQPLTLSATATDNVAVTSVTLYYRAVSAENYLSRAMVNTIDNDYYATLEGSLLTSPGIEYYIEASDGISVTRVGRAETPNLISVVDKPVVTMVTPNAGSSEGGTPVTLSGSNFKAGATVTFGGMAASNVNVVSSNQITCITPANIPATVDVRVTNPDGQHGVLLNGFTFLSTAAQVSLPNTGGGTGNLVSVPVNAANITGMVAASLTVNFDPDILTVSSASTGTLTAGWAFASNLQAPGQYRLSMSSPGGGVAGSGTLAMIEFEVVGAPGSSSALTISNILLNDGAITVELEDGVFSVDNVFNVSGAIAYWNGGLPVSGAKLTLTGDRVYEAFSGLDGEYTIQGAAIDAYTLRPSKENGDNGAISAYDASFALQHDVGLISLSGYAAMAADVNNNGHINSMDAHYILQKAADLISLPFPGASVAWKFDPTQRTLAELNQDMSGQNFTAVLLGDISGNWSDPGENSQAGAQAPRAASATLSLPEVSLLPAESTDASILLQLTEAELYGADLVLTYDPDHVAISAVRPGTLADGWSLFANLNEPGVVKIALAGAVPITAEGELVVFTLTALGEAGTQSTLSFTRGDLNEGSIPSTLNAGSVYIAVPVAAEFSANPVSGIAPLEVEFTNLSIGDWTSASWNFGDGNTSNEDSPSHTYTLPGTYAVSLTVSGPGGEDTVTKTGYIQVSTLNVSGQVLYWHENQVVPGASLSLVGANTHSATTGVDGTFNISGFPADAYTLTPTKENDIQGITAYDAALVLQHAVDLIQLDGHAARAADVSDSSGISAYDASFILQHSVGLIETFPDVDHMWIFDPANYVYPHLADNKTGQGFIAILMGDPSGNWMNEEYAQGSAARGTTASLTVQSGSVQQDETIEIAIDLSITTGEMLSADIILNYDPLELIVEDVKLGTLTADWMKAINLGESGVIRLALAHSEMNNSNGELLVLAVKAIGKPGTDAVMSFTRGDLNEGAIGTELNAGTIHILGAQEDPSQIIFLPLILR
ncbi:MAG: S8 family serine peptidase [Brevefilum sp.]